MLVFLTTIGGRRKQMKAAPTTQSFRLLYGWMVVLLLFCGTYHLQAASKDEQFTVNGVMYKVTDATNFYVTALGVADDNTLAEIDIPAQVKNNDETFTVTAYGGLGWTKDSHAKVIKLPETVTSIMGSAFSNYKNLTDFYIPK